MLQTGNLEVSAFGVGPPLGGHVADRHELGAAPHVVVRTDVEQFACATVRVLRAELQALGEGGAVQAAPWSVVVHNADAGVQHEPGRLQVFVCAC